MFEDDDYCFRVKKAGFDLVIAEDSFVYHKGSLTFNKLAVKEYQELFNKNRELYRKKHGHVWTYADIAIANWRKIFHDLSIISHGDIGAAVDRVINRTKNFDNALYQCREDEKFRENINGFSYIRAEFLENRRQLMEISDWATSLSHMNKDLNLKMEKMESTICNKIMKKIRNLKFFLKK